jgi:Ca2+-binding EF-hand superfamily protein
MSSSSNQLIVKFRNQLVKRGAVGIRNLSIFFRQIDENGSKTLSLDELQHGIKDHNIDMSREEISEMFRLFDRDKNGSISLNEFLQSVRVASFL